MTGPPEGILQPRSDYNNRTLLFGRSRTYFYSLERRKYPSLSLSSLQEEKSFPGIQIRPLSRMQESLDKRLKECFIFSLRFRIRMAPRAWAKGMIYLNQW